MNMVKNYVKTENGKTVITLVGDRNSFRCRQRSILSNGKKSHSLKFVSFKEMQQDIGKCKCKMLSEKIFYLDTIARL